MPRLVSESAKRARCGRNDNVGGGGEPHAAADRRAVDCGDRHEGQRGEASEEAPARGVERLKGIGLARLEAISPGPPTMI